MTLDEYIDIIEHSEFEWDGIGDNKCIGGDAYYTAHGIRKPLIGYGYVHPKCCWPTKTAKIG